jgi:four helix bundle protein
MKTFSFEKLEVWQLSRKLVLEIYKTTSLLPKEELYALTSQLRRAAISVSSNIAEGSSRKSPKDQARFSEIAYSSLIEVLNQLIIANDLLYIQEEELNDYRLKIDALLHKINALYNSQLKRSK